MTWHVRRRSYTGLSVPAEEFEEENDARQEAARMLRAARVKGFPVVKLRHYVWEVQEREDDAMVPDACGTVWIDHKTHECRECGGLSETEELARECCNYEYHDAEEDSDEDLQ